MSAGCLKDLSFNVNDSSQYIVKTGMNLYISWYKILTWYNNGSGGEFTGYQKDIDNNIIPDSSLNIIWDWSVTNASGTGNLNYNRTNTQNFLVKTNVFQNIMFYFPGQNIPTENNSVLFTSDPSLENYKSVINNPLGNEMELWVYAPSYPAKFGSYTDSSSN